MKLEHFKDLLKVCGINKKDFAEISNMSYGTVNSWGVEGRAEVPDWVQPFMEFYLKAKSLDQVKEMLCKDRIVFHAPRSAESN